MLKLVERIKDGVIKRLHVNMHVIRDNTKTGARNPPLTCKTGGKNLKASQIDIVDKDGAVVASIVYRPDDPLDCGARVWITSHAEVLVYENVDVISS